PTDAIKETPLEWPRSLRRFFSNPVSEHKETGIPGRGTEEMKTNDVTGRFGYGEAGFSIELGRPSTGTTFRDIEKVSTALAGLRVDFEPQNPLTYLMKNKETGELRDDIKNERVLSAIIEFKVPLNKAEDVLRTLRDVTQDIDTVFSVGVACRVNPDGSIPVASIIEKVGLKMYPNGKTNVGLGRKPSPVGGD
ncbi:MAG: 4Fe-4S ferredoxin, partial [Candidatus Bathyarchaeia archaeon]